MKQSGNSPFGIKQTQKLKTRQAEKVLSVTLYQTVRKLETVNSKLAVLFIYCSEIVISQ